MAFDHSSEHQAADAAASVNGELGRAYVEPGSEGGEPSILDPVARPCSQRGES